MDGFVRLIGKISIIFGMIMGVGLLIFAVILVFAPELLTKAIYYILIVVCVAAALYILIGLVRIGIGYLQAKRGIRDEDREEH